MNLEANFDKALVCKSFAILTDLRFYMLDRILSVKTNFDHII